MSAPDTSNISARRDAMLSEWEAIADRAKAGEKLEVYKRGTRLVFGLYEDLIERLRAENEQLKRRISTRSASPRRR